jgi:hypothetical protein
MSSRELFIHIGMPKTATSALQRFFTINRDALAQKGIAYPAAGNLEAHHRIGWALRSERGFGHWWFSSDVGTYDFEWQQVIRQCVLQRNLISTETFWGSTREDVSILKELSRRIIPLFIVYLRRQDSLRSALYAEQVKMGIERQGEQENRQSGGKIYLMGKSVRPRFNNCTSVRARSVLWGQYLFRFSQICLGCRLTEEYKNSCR